MTLLLLAALQGPPALAQDLPPITARVIAVEDLRLGLDGASFTVIAEVERTRGLPVVVRDLHLSLVVGDLDVVEAWNPEQKVKLRRGQPVEVAIPCTVSASSGLAAARRLATRGLPPVTLTGEVSGRVFILPVRHSFEAPVFDPDPPKDKPKGRR